MLVPQSEKIHSFAARMTALSCMMENEKGKRKKPPTKLGHSWSWNEQSESIPYSLLNFPPHHTHTEVTVITLANKEASRNLSVLGGQQLLWVLGYKKQEQAGYFF